MTAPRRRAPIPPAAILAAAAAHIGDHRLARQMPTCEVCRNYAAAVAALPADARP